MEITRCPEGFPFWQKWKVFSFWQKMIVVILIFLVSFIFKIYKIEFSHIHSYPFIGDATEYNYLSQQSIYVIFSSGREPMFPLALKIAFVIFPRTYWTQRYIDAIFGTICSILMFFFALKFSKNNLFIALLASVYITFSPIFNDNSVIGLRDSLFVLMILNLYLYVQKENSSPWILGILGALPVMTRINGLFTIIGPLFVKKIENKIDFKSVFLALSGYFLLLLPWFTLRVVETGDWTHRQAYLFSFDQSIFLNIKYFLIGFVQLFFGEVAAKSFFSFNSIPFLGFILIFAAYLIGLLISFRCQQWQLFLYTVFSCFPLIFFADDPVKKLFVRYVADQRLHLPVVIHFGYYISLGSFFIFKSLFSLFQGSILHRISYSASTNQDT